LTKGSIYGNFGNKDDVAVAGYLYQIEKLNQRFIDYLSPKKTMIAKLLGVTEYYRENWKNICERGGCPMLNAAVEADDNFPVLKKHVQQSIDNWAKSLARVIEKGIEKGEIKNKVVPLDYGYTIISMLEGGILLTKIMNNQKHIHQALDRIVTMIQTELKK
jgi:AcrR family transcriptional regulator